jgi:hypothetical protein
MISVSVFFDNHTEQETAGTANQTLEDFAALRGGQHLPRMAYHPPNVARLDAATPHLEGGVWAEPTLHPQVWDFVRIAREHPRCVHLVLCTNGVVLPRTREKLRAWIERLGTPLTLKLSLNHHLLDHDSAQ